MNSVIIGLCLLACLSFDVGHTLECYSCGSFAYGGTDVGNCDETFSKVTCDADEANCGKVELSGSLLGNAGSFTFTVRGCTNVEISGEECSDESSKADEITENIGAVGFSKAEYKAFQRAIALGTSPSYSGVAACTCAGELCNSAGVLQTNVMVICGSILMAVLAKFF